MPHAVRHPGPDGSAHSDAGASTHSRPDAAAGPAAGSRGGAPAGAAGAAGRFGRRTGTANYVVIAHGRRLVTVYGHLDRLLVQPGQQLNQGDVIGLEGSTGNSTGPHLHFETRLDGYWTDPLALLGSLVHP